jgi:hypothetical protein
MTTLLDISDDVRALADLIDETDAELTPEVEAALDQWFKELGDRQGAKLDAYAALIRISELRAAARREERDRLDRRIHADEVLAKRLKERLLLYFELTNQRGLETARYKIRVCQNGGVTPMKIDCPPESLPPPYQRHVVQANTEAIRKSLEAGNRIGGCELLPRGKHVRIS